MEKEYVEMTVKKLREFIENMPDETVVSIDINVEDKDNE